MKYDEYITELRKIEQEGHDFVDENIFFIFATSEEMAEKKLWEEQHLKPEEVYGLVGGGYCKKEDFPKINKFFDELHYKKRDLSLKYFDESLMYNLANLEYCCGLTELSEVFSDMCLTLDEINKAGISAERINGIIDEYMENTDYY